MQLLRMSFALIFAAAWAAEASMEVCRAGGQCEPSRVAAHAMLQTSKSSDRQKELSQLKGMERMYSQVQAMVSDVMATKRSLPDGAIELMNATLENTSVPAIRRGHADDQALMNGAVAALDNCETNFQADTTDASGVKEESNGKAQTHVACRGEESISETAKNEKWSSLSTFHDYLKVGLDGMEFPQDVSSMDGFFSQVLQWVAAHNATYTTKKQDFDTAESDLGTKHELCNQAQSAYEGTFCQWHTLASSGLSSHETCWSQGNTSFSLTKATVLDSADQRKAEYTAVIKIQCLLNVLKGEIEGIQDRLDACTGMTVETSFLGLVNTSMPSKSLPDFGNLTLQPGDAAWSQEYSGLPSNAPAALVSACAGAATTTTVTITQEATTLPPGSNMNPPAGYVAKSGSGPCQCKGSGYGLDSCGDLCCAASPYTDPDISGEYYYKKHNANAAWEDVSCYSLSS